MLRHPVQLTSLEEDFKKLGLLNEQEETMTQSGAGQPAPQMKPGPSGKPAPNKNGSRTVGAQSEGDSDEGKDGNVTVPGHEGADTQGNPTGKGAVKPPLPTTPGAQKESINGGDRRRQRLRGEAASEKDDEDEKEKEKDDDEDDDEDEKEEGTELEGSNRVMEAITRLRGGSKSESRQAKTESRETPSSHLDKVAQLIEDVNGIMESIDTSRRGDAVRAFANAAIISEMLSKGFAHFAEEYQDEEFAGAAEAFASMSEDAANVAHTLEEGEEVDPDALQEEFRAQMDALMEGLDLYSDVVEADSELEEEEEVEEETEEETEEEVEEGTETETEDSKTEASSMAGSSYRKKFGKSKAGVGSYKAAGEETETESGEEVEEEAVPQRATGGIMSTRPIGESYFRHGKMGPSGKKTAGMKK